VVNGDRELKSLFQKRVMALFREGPFEAALARLMPRFFSANAERILRDAASETDNAPFSDKIVRALLKSRRGLLSGRMPMDRIAEAVEKLRPTPREGADKAPPRSWRESTRHSLRFQFPSQSRCACGLSGWRTSAMSTKWSFALLTL
jgi:hypothetical protein